MKEEEMNAPYPEEAMDELEHLMKPPEVPGQDRGGGQPMDASTKLRSMFPKGSADFFKANETETRPQLSNPRPKHNKKAALDRLAKRRKGVGRITVRYRLCRVRPLDPDAVAGSN